jgi:hypothetical protein
MSEPIHLIDGKDNLVLMLTDTVILSALDRLRFRRDGRVVVKNATVRDIGFGQSRVYMDDSSCLVPTELLLR